jgi:hypothetical protein
MTDRGHDDVGELDELSFEELMARSSVSVDTDPDLDDTCTVEEADAFAAEYGRVARRDVPAPNRHADRGPANNGVSRRPRRLMMVACLVVLGGFIALTSRDAGQDPADVVAPSLTPETGFIGDLTPESGSWSAIKGTTVLDGMTFERTMRAQVRACGPPGTVRYAVPPTDAIYRTVVGLEDTAPRALTVKLKVTHRGRTVFSQELENGASALFTVAATPGDWSTMTLHWAPTGGTCGDTSYLVFGDPQL